MAKKADASQLGKWAFIIGGLVAVIHAFYAIPYAGWIFAIAGIVIGAVNVKDRDAVSFLVVLLALTLGSVSNWLGIVPAIGAALNAIVGNVVALLSPAALVVALKCAYALTKR